LLAQACGQMALVCASSHHQGLDHLGRGLTPVAWSEDGLVEAVERLDGWLVAVQWHPEETASKDPGQQALFDAFVERARGRDRT
jgi:putative glutamine amidotransferase